MARFTGSVTAWREKRLSYHPALDSFRHRFLIYASNSRGIFQNHSAPARIDPNICRPISILFLPRCPSTKPRPIDKAVIRSIQRKAGNGLAHVRKEVREVQPPIANPNATSTVPMKILAVRISTPFDHVAPSGVGAASRSACGMPVLCHSRGNQCPDLTSATLGVSVSNDGRNAGSFRSAIAADRPLRLSFRSFFCRPQNGPAPKPCPDRGSISHSVSSCLRGVGVRGRAALVALSGFVDCTAARCQSALVCR